MQTVSIVGNLQLQWPPSVASLTSFLGLNALRLDSLSFVRPECLLQARYGVKFVQSAFSFVRPACLLQIRR